MLLPVSPRMMKQYLHNWIEMVATLKSVVRLSWRPSLSALLASLAVCYPVLCSQCLFPSQSEVHRPSTLDKDTEKVNAWT